MNRIQVRKLNMFMVVWTFISSLSPAIIALMPHFGAYFTDFQLRVTLLREQFNLQISNTSAYRVLKNSEREIMVNNIMRLLTNIIAFVDFEEDLILRNSVNFSRSYLLKLPEQVCATLCMQLHDIGVVHLVALSAYGETEASLTDLKGSVITYRDTIPTTKSKIDVRVMATAEIALEFKAATTLLWKMTNSFRRLILSHSAEYKMFMISRKLVNPITVPLAIKGRVFDILGAPIGLVRVVMEEMPRRQIKRTSMAGRFQYKYLEDGMYTLIFSRSGYVTKKEVVYVTKGIRTELKVTMLEVTDALPEEE